MTKLVIDILAFSHIDNKKCFDTNNNFQKHLTKKEIVLKCMVDKKCCYIVWNKLATNVRQYFSGAHKHKNSEWTVHKRTSI